eukprot:CAMPEP_0202689130 /NCGR_PEP_ID=MMETSP1385-20130828/4471_1 /ASSEMBLY_ACC=CAM_ASM_000861 /TAXON_ID=933848 /ORGANISM="Elphidium margaritaceum" /LENGTH=1090 /DNA_ID=CAMNT_0049344223 /DNA_START=33 /DNA_END=3305 /DNA_ORIENTATION=+
MASKKKKKKTKVTSLAMGDTVKLTKGRLGLVRFIGKTQFGLGEWIGIELYNELMKTRHNGAVIGKRYFRCPANRGVFVRRALIKENVAVLDIQPAINLLREKEKTLKDEHKKQRAEQREGKRAKNESKRAAKAAKIQKKYASKSPEPSKANGSFSSMADAARSAAVAKVKPASIDVVTHQKKTYKRIPITDARTPPGLNAQSRRTRERDSQKNNLNNIRSRSANPPSSNSSNDQNKDKESKRGTRRPKTPTRRPKTPTNKQTTSTGRTEKTPKGGGGKRNSKRVSKPPVIEADDDDNTKTRAGGAALPMTVAKPMVVRAYDTDNKAKATTSKQVAEKKQTPKKKRTRSRDGDRADDKVEMIKMNKSRSTPSQEKVSKSRPKTPTTTSKRPKTPKTPKTKGEKEKEKAKVKTTPKPISTDSTVSDDDDDENEPSVSMSASDGGGDDDIPPLTAATPVVEDLDQLDELVQVQEETVMALPQPKSIPVIAPPKQWVESEKQTLKSNDYKLKNFNTNFASSLRQRKGNDSLQLMIEKKNKAKLKDRTQQKTEEKDNETEKDKATKSETEKEKESTTNETATQKKKGIDIFNDDEKHANLEPDVISDRIQDNVDPNLIRGLTPKLQGTTTTAAPLDALSLDAVVDGDDHKSNVALAQAHNAASPKQKTRSKVSLHMNDGVLDSDEDSLNDEEEDEHVDGAIDEELKKEIEDDYDANFENILKSVDEYTHTIDDIEVKRKRLADKLVSDVRRMSRSNSAHNGGGAVTSPVTVTDIDADADVNTRRRSGAHSIHEQPPAAAAAAQPPPSNDVNADAELPTRRRSGAHSIHQQQPPPPHAQPQQASAIGDVDLSTRRRSGAHSALKRQGSNKMNVNLLMASTGAFRQIPRFKKESKKQYDSARSRRGSSFVDDYNVMDTLFFDGDEENTSMNNNDDNFFVDSMGDDDDDDDEDDGDDGKDNGDDDADAVNKTDGDNDDDDDDDEDDEDDDEDEETAREEDPLLGRIEDIVIEEEEEDEEQDFTEEAPEWDRSLTRIYKMSDILEDDESAPKVTYKSDMVNVPENTNEDEDELDAILKPSVYMKKKRKSLSKEKAALNL